MTAKKRGRPSKLRPDLVVQKAICDNLTVGCPRSSAAILAGVSSRTFFTWMDKGKASSSGPFHDFRRAVLQAERECERGLVMSVVSHSQTDGKLALEALRAKFRKRWPKETQKHDITARVSAGVDDSFTALADLLARRAGEAEEDSASPEADAGTAD